MSKTRREIVVKKLSTLIRGEREAKARGDRAAYDSLTGTISGYCNALEDALGVKEADRIYRDALGMI